MLKRIYAFSLSIMMLISLCPVAGVFAADSKPAAVNETFEDSVVDTAIVDFNSTVSKEVADGVGQGGGKALKITDLNNTACIGFSASYRPNYDALVLSFDIQISKTPTPDTQSNKEMVMAGSKSTGGNKTLSLYRKLSGSSADFSFKTYGGETYDLEIGEWYRIVTVRTGYTMSTWVLDADNSVLLYQTRAEMGAQDEFSIIRGTTNAMGDGEIMLDNVSFIHYDATAYGFSVIESTIESPAIDIPRNTNSIIVVLDGKIATGDAVLKPEIGENIVCTVTPSVDGNSKELPLTYTISWEGTLASNTGYTLDLTALKNEMGVATTEQIAFTTLDASKVHLWETPIISTAVPNTADATKTDITFKISDSPEYANTSFTGAVMAVILRDGQMADFDIIADTFTADTSITKTFRFTVEASDKLQLIQMDTQNGLTPLAWAEYSVE